MRKSDKNEKGTEAEFSFGGRVGFSAGTEAELSFGGRAGSD
jgi:hypothetical protein